MPEDLDDGGEEEEEEEEEDEAFGEDMFGYDDLDLHNR